MKIFFKYLLLTTIYLGFNQKIHSQTVNISGVFEKWEKITLSLKLPTGNLIESESTFKDKRMDVIFTDPSGETIRVPGFFAADGNAANSGASSGDVFKAYLRPYLTGDWTYEILYYTGIDVALSSYSSLPAPIYTLSGSINNINASTASLPDLKAKGRLLYQTDGTLNQRRYLKFSETGEYFLKIGPDSPENLLHFNEFDFDGTPANCGIVCSEHIFAPHATDFVTGNPTWMNGKGKNIIGVMNFLRNQDMNSVSMSLYGGDDINVYPWINATSQTTYDVSKLEQWEIVFNHAEAQGLLMHFKLAERENWNLLNNTQLRIYYREMVARFGHHLAIEWNISEEYGQGGGAQAAETAIDKIDWLTEIDPWQNHRVIHTFPGQHNKYQEWLDLNAKLTGASIQSPDNNNYQNVYNSTSGILHWVNKSRENSTPWVVCSDEQGPGTTGVFTSTSISNSTVTEFARTRVLWKTLIAGGAGVMWYGGGAGDFITEDFDRFSTLFDWNRFAVIDFFKNNNIEFWNTENNDLLVSNGANCLAEEGKTYIIYLENGGSTTLDLNDQLGSFDIKWFDPRNGGNLQNGSITSQNGGTIVNIGNPPNNTGSDWVALITSTTSATCNQNYVLNAINDFPTINVAGFKPSMKESSLGALSINSTLYPGQFAAAETTFSGEDGIYNIGITTLVENDGESTYKIVVNGQVKGSYTNPVSTVNFAEAGTTFNGIELYTGDVIRVEFNAHTNGNIPLGNSTDYSRGRWKNLTLCQTQNFQPTRFIPGQFEAEDYTSHSGTEIVNIILDTGSDRALGSLNNGDQVTYDVNVANTGTYELTFRIATPFNMPNDKIVIKSDGVVVGQLLIKPTGGWQVWEDQSVEIDLTSGIHTITLEFGDYIYQGNLNWLKFEELSSRQLIPGQFEAEDITSNSGTVVQNITTDTGSDKALSSLNDGDSVTYNVNVASTGTYTTTFRIATPFNKPNDKIIIKSDGVVVGQLLIKPTGGWQVWEDQSVDINLTAGNHILTLEFADYLYMGNLNWLKFEELISRQLIPGQFEAEDITSNSGTVVQNITTDTGSDKALSSLNDGDSVTYNVNVASTGTYTTTFRIATPFNKPNDKIVIKSDGVVVGQLLIKPTGGWQVWEDQSVNIDLTAGNHILTLEFADYLYMGNLNWLKFEELISRQLIPGQFEAEDITSNSGTVVQNITTDTGSDKALSSLNDGDSVTYNVNVASTGTYTTTFRIATPFNKPNDKIIIKSNGVVVGQLLIKPTGGWQVWEDQSVNIDLTAGNHILTLEFADYLYMGNLNWIDFSPAISNLKTMFESTEKTLENRPIIYPNPIKGHILNIKSDNPVLSLKLYDISGRLIYSSSKNTNVIEMSHFNNSIYLLKITTTQGEHIEKVIKNR